MNYGEAKRELNRLANFAKAFAAIGDILDSAQQAENLLKTAQKDAQTALESQKSAQNAIPALQAKIDSLETVYAEKMTSLDEELALKKDELDKDLEGKRAAVLHEIDTLEAILKKAQAEHGAKMADLQGEQDAAEKEVANWQQKLTEAQAAYDAFKTAVGA